jgi:alpha-glucosidase
VGSVEEEGSSAPWWQTAVVYQIYPRSFADANGDGVGDLAGITSQLDHLVWLGVDALWLSPFYRSPMKDFGYDVADYCDVDPIFGNLEDFDALLEAAHARGLKLMIDWVPAHSSSEHPWFVDARASRQSDRRNWYVWRDAGPGGELPNNWKCAFSDAPAWTFDAGSGQYYLHSFLAEQPDLNWEEPKVEAAMHEVLRFWLERGVDGFRADVISNIGKDPALASVEEARAKVPPFVFRNEPVTHEYLRRIRALLDTWPGDRAMVGEIPVFDSKEVATFYGAGDELHMAFNFPPLYAPFEAPAWRERIEVTTGALDPRDAWPTWVLSNHDVPRHRTRYGNEARARAAAVLLLTLRGTPFLYMGEELGLEDALVPAACKVDPGGRDGCRAPLPWSRAQGHGWGGAPWLPWPPDAAERSVEAQRDDPGSMLHLYRRLLAARRASPALRLGDFAFLEAPEGLLCWRRDFSGDCRFVVINFEDRELEWPQDDRHEVEVASDGRGESQVYDSRVRPNQALILKPTRPARA